MIKFQDKKYVCECGKKLKIIYSINTDWYGTLDYMHCSYCNDRGEKMVGMNGILLGIAANR